ncbi:MAG TPA: alpha/beta hydrolase [Anaerolineales bacterium]|nr:alpha/beta hydrolase [Anaerolineales bacterium]
MSKLSQQIQLPDGRRLGYDEYGPAEGKPVFYFHGSPSSRVEWRIFGSDALAQELGLRVIVPDRPGMGLSDFQPGRRLSDWPSDVVALAGHLALDRFAVLGYSLGGPYAAVCARRIPDRLTRAALVSSTSPYNIPGVTEDINPGTLQFLNLARDNPRLNQLFMRMLGFSARYLPKRMIANAMANLPPSDREVVADPEVQRTFLEMVKEALRQGPRGVQVDAALLVSPWDFELEDIKMSIHLWHGEEDRNAPPAMGRYLADAIPNSQARFLPGEGHLSLFVHHIEEILLLLRGEP